MNRPISTPGPSSWWIAFALCCSLWACAAEVSGPESGGISIVPPRAWVEAGRQETFAATPPTVTWSVREGDAGGVITSDGVYTAPAASGVFTIVAVEPTSGARGEARVQVGSGPPAQGLTIPTTHPRVFFAGADDPRLAQARSWFAANPYTPSAYANDYPRENAFAGLVTANATDASTYCRRAIAFATTPSLVPLASCGGGSDQARAYGETIAVVYDWCYHHMTAGERANLISEVNAWMTSCMNASWGGPHMVNSNYFWGYLRNQLLWGIATYHENTAAAQTFIDNAITTRWGNVVARAAPGGFLEGGVNHEGSAYGHYGPGYIPIALSSTALLGRDLWSDGYWWRSAILALIYNTSPTVTYCEEFPANSGWDVIPWSDDDYWRSGNSALRKPTTRGQSSYYGDFMKAVADHWPTSNYGRWAQQWLETTGATYGQWLSAVSANATTPLSFSTLPLDYHARGIGWLYSRASWDHPDRAWFNVELGVPREVGHQQARFGSWGLWRGGRWLSRDTVAYSGSFVGYGGVGSAPSGTMRNLVLVNPDSQGCVENLFMTNSATCVADGAPFQFPVVPASQSTTRRLQSAAGFSFVNVDLTATYQNTASGYVSRMNPAVAHLERDFVFVRDIETLVILDRIEARAVGGVAASAIKRATTMSCEVPWTVEDATHATCEHGPQAMRVTTLLPAAPSRHAALYEGNSPHGQYRLEIEDTPGTAQSYLLHVVQARPHPGVNLNPAVTDNGSSFTVTLDATHSVTFAKGMSSSGGSITIGASTTPFRSDAQMMSITDAGPVWHP